jgi:PKD domain-containing protein
MDVDPPVGRFVARCATLVAILAVVLTLVPALAAATPVTTPIPHGGFAEAVPACAPPAPGYARCFALVRKHLASRPAGRSAASVQPFLVGGGAGTALAGPAGGLTPEDLASAYGFSPSSGGAGETVAIVDAFDDPNIESDLAKFDAEYTQLPSCTSGNGCFKKVGQTGSIGALPAADTTGWSVEITLDVDAVHAACPNCKVLLVEANNNSNANLAAATNTAVALGASVVSNSYGGPEQFTGSSEVAAYNHPGVPIVASTGDDGFYNWNTLEPEDEAANLPAASPDVVAVGGTTLELNGDGTRANERIWNWNEPLEPDEPFFTAGASGGGCSRLFEAPRWQRDVAGFAATGCGAKRLNADVSMVGDPDTGLDIYDDYNCGSKCAGADEGWVTIGGTSLSAPLVSGLYALAGGAQGISYPSLTLYGAQADATGRFDVTEGGNGYCDGEPAAECGHPDSFFGRGRIDCEGTTECDAAAGYDGPSGVGTPVGLGLFRPQLPTAAISAPSAPVARSAASFSASGSADFYPGDSIAAAAWSWGDGTSSGGVATTHTYAAPGTYTVTLTVTDAYALTSSAATREVTVGPAAVVEGGGGGGGTSGGGGTGGGSSGGGTTTTTTTTTSTTTSGGGAQQGVAGFQSVSPQAASAHLASSSLKVGAGSVKLAIACAASGGSCAGTVTLTAPAGGHASAAKTKTLTLGKASFTVAAGKTLTVTLHLSRQALAQLARTHGLHATATIVLRTGSGAARTVHSAVTLHPAPAARRSR